MRYTRRSASSRRETSREGSTRFSQTASQPSGGPCRTHSDPVSSGPGRSSSWPPGWSVAATRSSSCGSQPTWGSRVTRWQTAWQRRRQQGRSTECPTRLGGRRAPPHLSRRATEQRSKDTSWWVVDHVRPERRYIPPGGPGFRRRAMRRVL